jgi:hypothetical protein
LPVPSFTHAFIGIEGAPEFWKGALVFSEELIHAAHHVPTWVKWLLHRDGHRPDRYVCYS